MQTDKIVRAPAVGILYTQAQTLGIGRADLCVGGGTGEPNLKIRILPQKLCQLNADGIDDVLLAQSVSFRARARVEGMIMMLCLMRSLRTL